jgi:nitrate reductase NapE component
MELRMKAEIVNAKIRFATISAFILNSIFPILNLNIFGLYCKLVYVYMEINP